jgi:hypothetical protein
MRSAFRTLGFALLVIFTACGDSSGPDARDPYADAAGTYVLTAANGVLPYTYFQNSAGRVEIYSATLVLRSDRSYTETINARTVFTSGAPSTTSSSIENGTYTVVGTQLTFTIPPSGGSAGFSYTGALSGRDLTYTYEGLAMRYTK